MRIYPENLDDAHSLIHDLEGLTVALQSLLWELTGETIDEGSRINELRTGLVGIGNAIEQRFDHMNAPKLSVVETSSLPSHSPKVEAQG